MSGFDTVRWGDGPYHLLVPDTPNTACELNYMSVSGGQFDINWSGKLHETFLRWPNACSTCQLRARRRPRRLR